jgi:hypothetical protein
MWKCVVVMNIMCSVAEFSRVCMCMYLSICVCMCVYVTDFPEPYYSYERNKLKDWILEGKESRYL